MEKVLIFCIGFFMDCLLKAFPWPCAHVAIFLNKNNHFLHRVLHGLVTRGLPVTIYAHLAIFLDFELGQKVVIFFIGYPKRSRQLRRSTDRKVIYRLHLCPSSLGITCVGRELADEQRSPLCNTSMPCGRKCQIHVSAFCYIRWGFEVHHRHGST